MGFSGGNTRNASSRCKPQQILIRTWELIRNLSDSIMAQADQKLADVGKLSLRGTSRLLTLSAICGSLCSSWTIKISAQGMM